MYPHPVVPADALSTYVDEGLVGEVKELVELDSTVGVLLERTRGLLGSSLLASCELSLVVSSILHCGILSSPASSEAMLPHRRHESHSLDQAT